MAKKPVHLVAINKTFESAQQLINEIRNTVQEFKGKPLVILFPETVLGNTPISRINGKTIAKLIAPILTIHGNAAVSYSVFEHRKGIKGKGKNPLITNTGYLIFPQSKQNLVGYKAYPKITTYYKGKSLTRGDTEVITKNSKQTKVKKAKEKFHRLAGKIKSFPRITFKGKTIEMRICADATNQEEMDMHPAKKSKQQSHLILVPAEDLTIKPNELYQLTKKLVDGGIALILDKHRKKITIASKLKNGIGLTTLKKPSKLKKWFTKKQTPTPHKHGKYRIHVK